MEKRFRIILDRAPQNGGEPEAEGDNAAEGEVYVESPEELERKTIEFQKILEVPKEERDRVQRMQVIDRAAAAIAAARSIIAQNPPKRLEEDGDRKGSAISSDSGGGIRSQNGGKPSQNSYTRQTRPSRIETPGPDFWSWVPPPGDDSSLDDSNMSQTAQKPSSDANQMGIVLEKDASADTLKIPFESKLYESKITSSLPPLQSKLEREKTEKPITISENTASNKEHEIQFTEHAAEAARALEEIDEKPSHGTTPDGSRYWKDTGIEKRPDGVVCRWTLIRGVSADKAVEWEEKYWEAADDFGYKELGSEKSGRDAYGDVWHEYWRESLWEEGGLMHIEKTADKWGKKGEDDEWQEKWWEHYDASGKADKWAHKWCRINPNTQLEPGHAHVWHEKWGEKYDGHGGSDKYTDKWAERFEGDGWSKWGDKWDEHFDLNGNGVKQGETWWQGKYGESWNRTWGEQHNGSGWLHKYGRSSCGEHWDTHVQEDTWYQRYPHFGFMHCLENTVQLREVKKPSDSE